MKKLFLYIFPLLIFLGKIAYAYNRVYEHVFIADWSSPTVKELHDLQLYLQYEDRPLLYFLNEFNAQGIPDHGSRIERVRNFVLISPECQEVPRMQIKYYNISPNAKDVCILSYVSMQDRYVECMHLLENSLERMHFKGHFLFQIGGWPFLEGGGLKLCDIPYAFKVCAIKEAQRLGYKRVLWLDSALEINRSIMPLFIAIKKHGAIFFHDQLPFSFPSFRYMLSRDNHVTRALNTCWEETQHYAHLSAAVMGFDLENKKVLKLLDEWYKVTEQGFACFTSIPEQLPLSILVHRHHLTEAIMNNKKFSFIFSIRAY